VQSTHSISPVSAGVVAASVSSGSRARNSKVSVQPRKTHLSPSRGFAQNLLARELGVMHRRSSSGVVFRTQSVVSSRPDRFLLVLGALALATLVLASTSLLRMLRHMSGSPPDW
jgi:hypothetical protein